MTESEIALLDADGWFSREDSLGAIQTAASARQRVSSNQLSAAGFSRGRTHDTAVRGDSSQWLKQTDADFSAMWALFEALRCELNRDAWLGLVRFDVQLAHYAGNGEAYGRHRDAFDGAESRRITAILYLNPEWNLDHGGQLRLHTSRAIDVDPVLGRLVVFRSARVEHEVLASLAPRLAVTAWYYG